MKLLLRLEEKRNEENIFKVKKERLRIQEEGTSAKQLFAFNQQGNKYRRNQKQLKEERNGMHIEKI
jgi:hypothetical protein